jgi:hypothetical protein
LAIDTYAKLVTAVGDFMGRADVTTAKVDYFIEMTEGYLNKKVRAHEMETTNGSLTVSSGVYTHSSDFLGWKQVSITSNGVRHQLRPIDLEQRSFVDDGTTGTPLNYVVRAGTTVFVPTPDSTGYTYDGTYYHKIPNLSANTTAGNWVLSNYSDVYLWGCLTGAGVFFPGGDSRTGEWKELFLEAVDGLKKVSREKGFGQVGTLQTEYPVY